MIASKARTLRAEGKSWKEIGETLHVSRTSARRLCLNSFEAQARKARGLLVVEDEPSQPPFRNGTTNVPFDRATSDKTPSRSEPPTAEREETDAIPKSLRMFARLLDKANQDDQEGE